MRKLTVSFLAAAALAGGALTGAAFAAPAHHHASSAETRSIDRNQSKQRHGHDRSHERMQKEVRDR